MRVAIVGAGISGLGCAHALLAEQRRGLSVTLYEAALRPGGHTNTVDVALDGKRYPVDTGFLVFNERTYPNLIRLFGELEVPVAASDMSFAVSLTVSNGFGHRQLEWAGTDLSGVFAQRRNVASPKFLHMLADLLRFNRQATRIALGTERADALSLGEFLDRHRYGQPFRRMYLLPMAAAIWSCPMAAMLAYPALTFVRFCHNHGLLQIEGRPQWYTVRGGARQYVERIVGRLTDVRLGDRVQQVRRDARSGKVQVTSCRGRDSFDHVVLASHSDQSLRLLADASDAERSVLAGVGYQPNRAILHTDASLMPATRRVWSSWNCLSDGAEKPEASVTYWLNRLQPLPFSTPVFVSLNPLREPDPAKVLAEFDYAHPVFDAGAIAAQQRLPALQGANRVWFAGAWTGFGFHEDGLKSGLAVAARLRALLREPARRAA